MKTTTYLLAGLLIIAINAYASGPPTSVMVGIYNHRAESLSLALSSWGCSSNSGIPMTLPTGMNSFLANIDFNANCPHGKASPPYEVGFEIILTYKSTGESCAIRGFPAADSSSGPVYWGDVAAMYPENTDLCLRTYITPANEVPEYRFDFENIKTSSSRDGNKH